MCNLFHRGLTELFLGGKGRVDLFQESGRRSRTGAMVQRRRTGVTVGVAVGLDTGVVIVRRQLEPIGIGKGETMAFDLGLPRRLGGSVVGRRGSVVVLKQRPVEGCSHRLDGTV